ncbi:hypothetical protein [Pseudoramibacter alactolyticus]|jgi:hypothetical protein|uniref:hypothetical protein n=1 Tax=Pseudoramibacter alactolyticus TaxID=113287 RepID=UPI002353CE62|nr:hypothetical protein [Pseudoramibacter alactolyticus]MBM6967487.1 hypothetical protein [Pseudoramibacter alactolyticus]
MGSVGDNRQDLYTNDEDICPCSSRVDIFCGIKSFKEAARQKAIEREPNQAWASAFPAAQNYLKISPTNAVVTVDEAGIAALYRSAL